MASPLSLGALQLAAYFRRFFDGLNATPGFLDRTIDPAKVGGLIRLSRRILFYLFNCGNTVLYQQRRSVADSYTGEREYGPKLWILKTYIVSAVLL